MTNEFYLERRRYLLGRCRDMRLNYGKGHGYHRAFQWNLLDLRRDRHTIEKK